MGYRGSIYKWQRGTATSTVVREPVDRFLANDGWYNMFPNAAIIHLPRYRSDHTLVLFKMDYIRGGHQGDRLFKFESLWLSREECGEVVAAAWNERAGGSVVGHVELCSNSLSAWAAETFGFIRKKIREAEKELQDMQGLLPGCKGDK